LNYNVRNLIFSCDDGIIKKIRLKHYIPKTKSLGRKFIEGGYKTIYSKTSDELNKKYNKIKDKLLIDKNNIKYAIQNRHILVNEKHRKYITFDSQIKTIEKMEKMEKEENILYNKNEDIEECDKSNSSICSSKAENPII
jgi:predicted oxidoreductase